MGLLKRIGGLVSGKTKKTRTPEKTKELDQNMIAMPIGDDHLTARLGLLLKRYKKEAYNNNLSFYKRIILKILIEQTSVEYDFVRSSLFVENKELLDKAFGTIKNFAEGRENDVRDDQLPEL